MGKEIGEHLMKTIKVVVGLGWGDEGKGQAVNHLSNDNTVVIRFSGGSQAAHNVSEKGNHHTFHMFGSGTFKGADTFLSKYTLVCPFTIEHEAEELQTINMIPNVKDRIKISLNSTLILPHHVAVSRHASGIHNRGTCGMGVGTSFRHQRMFPNQGIYARDLKNRKILIRKLIDLEKWANSIIDDLSLYNISSPDDYADFLMNFSKEIEFVNDEQYLESIMTSNKEIIFEGSQGMLLDPIWGHLPPYVTSTRLTLNPIIDLIEHYDHYTDVYGCIRMYLTRHGSGPFPTEDDLDLPEPHNVCNPYQKDFRTGWMDLRMLELSIDALDNKVDQFIVSHTDYWDRIPEWKIRNQHGLDQEWLYPKSLDEYLSIIGRLLPIDMIGIAPDTRVEY